MFKIRKVFDLGHDFKAVGDGAAGDWMMDLTWPDSEFAPRTEFQADPSALTVDPLPDDHLRQQFLDLHNITRVGAEESLERLARVARIAARTPAAAVVFSGAEGCFIKAVDGAQIDDIEPLTPLFVDAIASDSLLIRDFSKISAGAPRPFLEKSLNSFLSSPIRAETGLSVGAICVLDNRERAFSQLEFTAIEDMSRIAADQLLLRRLATHDPASGALTESCFKKNIEKEMARVRRYGGDLSLLAIDVDRFGQINDRYGRSVGDLVLRQVHDRLVDTLRTADRVGRAVSCGFLAALPETNLEGAKTTAERIRATVSRRPFIANRMQTSLTVSIGAVSFDPTTDDYTSLLDRAKRLLGDAKRSGGDRLSEES